MDLTSLLTVFGAYFIAALVKGVTGIGFSTSALPILAFTIGLKEALPLLLLPSLASNLFVMRQYGGFHHSLVAFRWMFIFTALGVLIGLTILSRVESMGASVVLGVVLMLWSGFSFAKPHVAFSDAWAARLQPVSGFATGTINGITGSQVMPLLPFLMAQNLPRESFVQASNISFSLSSVLMGFGLIHLDLLTTVDLTVSALGLAPVALGVWLGAKLGQRVSQQAYLRGVLALLSLSGLTLIARPFFV